MSNLNNNCLNESNDGNAEIEKKTLQIVDYLLEKHNPAGTLIRIMTIFCLYFRSNI